MLRAGKSPILIIDYTPFSPSVPELLAYAHVIRDRLNAPCIDVPFHDEEDARPEPCTPKRCSA